MIAGVVWETAPPLPSQQSAQQLLLSHQACWNFIQADAIAKRLSPDETARWSQFRREPGSSSGPLVDGYWGAQGYVHPVQGETEDWLVCFKPGDKQALYVKVGNKSQGDFDAAARIVAAARDRNAGATRSPAPSP